MKRLRSLVSLNGDDIHHKQVDKIAGGLYPDHLEFPWDRLRDYTDACIKKQKGISIPEGLDLFLISFIQKHAAKDIAMAAVAHALSTEATLSLLNGILRLEPGNFDGLEQFIHIMVAINHVNPSAISDVEANRARAILLIVRLIDPDSLRKSSPPRLSDSSQALLSLSTLFMQGIPLDSILCLHILALTKLASSSLSEELHEYKATSQWWHACIATSWLSKLLHTSTWPQEGNLSLNQILESTFPTWRSWALWKSDEQVLLVFMKKLDDTDRRALRDILALEGPCFDGYTSTLKEAYITEIWESGSVRLRKSSLEILFSSDEPVHLRETLNSLVLRLLQALTAAVSTDSSWLQLFKQVCVGKAIHQEGLRLLEECFNIGWTSLVKYVITILQCQENAVQPPLVCVLNLVSALDTNPCQALRPLIGFQVLDAATNIFKTKQEHLRSIIKINRLWVEQDLVTIRELYGFGKALESSAWVMTALEPSTKSLLVQWPFMGQIQDCFSIRTQAQSLIPHPATSVTQDVGSYVVERLVQTGKCNHLSAQSYKSSWSLYSWLLLLWQHIPCILNVISTPLDIFLDYRRLSLKSYRKQ
jgi:hypothetical protein